jgi:hypothetical protein
MPAIARYVTGQDPSQANMLRQNNMRSVWGRSSALLNTLVCLETGTDSSHTENIWDLSKPKSEAKDVRLTTSQTNLEELYENIESASAASSVSIEPRAMGESAQKGLYAVAIVFGFPISLLCCIGYVRLETFQVHMTNETIQAHPVLRWGEKKIEEARCESCEEGRNTTSKESIHEVEN